MFGSFSEWERNTVRSVVPIRLGDGERQQIAAAAARRKLTLSGFVREAAVAASAIVQGKATVQRPSAPRVGVEAPTVVDSGRGVVVVDPEPAEHWVDGERIR